MKIRFQADADFNQAIVTGVLRRQPSIDFKSANASNDSEDWVNQIASLPL